MSHKMIANLGVADLSKSIAFFKSLGFQFNPKFTDGNAACMVIGPDSAVMLLTPSHFKMLAPIPMTDTSKSIEGWITLSCESRAAVDEIVKKAVAAGGKTYEDPMDHEGMMYAYGFKDLDGHFWNMLWMDPKVPQPCSAI